MYAKVLLCLALPAVANAMGLIVDARKACLGPDGSSATADKVADVATKDDCIDFCQSESAAYPENCQRSIVWKDDCGADTTGTCGEFTGSENCWCNYQVACGCECYFCPIPDWLEIIDPAGGTYPVPDWDAISPCLTPIAGGTC